MSLALRYPPERDNKTLLPRTPYTFATGLGEVGLVLTGQEVSCRLLSFESAEHTLQAAARGRAASVLPTCPARYDQGARAA